MRNARDRKLPDKAGTGEIVIIMMVIDTTIMIGSVDPNSKINVTKKETLKLKNKVELTVVEVAKTVAMKTEIA